MASTITNLINTINVAFPVAGQDNDSQGFRDNFNIIQQSLLATESEIENIQNTVNTLGGSVYSTATHIVALQDVSIGTATNVVLSVDQGTGDLIITGDSASGVVVTLSEQVTATVVNALTDSVTNSTTGTFGVQDVKNILTGATVYFQSQTRTVTSVDHSTNYITVTPEFTVPPFSVGTILTFQNPYNNPVGNLYITGDIFASGNITAYAGAPSDARLKENVVTITDALSKVNSMRGVFYDWTDSYLEMLNFSPLLPKHDTGVIAQEVQEVVPEIVFMKSNGDLGVKYEKLAGFFIEAIKELSAKVDTLQAQVNALTTGTNV